ncbi:MAG: hypothetical protein COV29_00620 [Candidatus Yanofskybacteria bacterium CG10_big_fil_rev_8_21_14_0_10_36_16]|uniref:Uncharacterized protein n=1 Tax=Candidatus Yanofskybacteria bacterium CG10_big_fil_rev_8_21_14_0_10_36_16 TaxID=1975096 RepID=A0A2J0Q8D7_9BACT|nr:MAG: hypothetical protein COV29_00620 [Candidatus Yanofskybacteria bacterium CG10_big_fil_rev_8_21_14_0_10_36_16]
MSNKNKKNNNPPKHFPSGPVFESGLGWGEKLKNWFKEDFLNKFLPAIAILVLIAGVLSFLQKNSSKEDLVTDEYNSETKESIIKIAKPRDSYTILARQALSEYLTENPTDLTNGQKVFIEETLRREVEEGTIQIGQEVTFQISNIKDAIDKANSLTPFQLQKWQAWAETVEFNDSF